MTPINAGVLALIAVAPTTMALLLSDTTVTALGVAFMATIPPTIAALAALSQSRQNAKNAADTSVKTDSLIKKTDEIHVMTNSNLTQITAQLQVANAEIAGLKQVITALSGKTTGALS